MKEVYSSSLLRGEKFVQEIFDFLIFEDGGVLLNSKKYEFLNLYSNGREMYSIFLFSAV